MDADGLGSNLAESEVYAHGKPSTAVLDRLHVVDHQGRHHAPNRALIINDGTHWIVATAGYEALGMNRPVFDGHTGASQVLADEIGTDDPTDAEIDASNEVDTITQAKSAPANIEAAKPRTRDNSKQATVIAMLKRPEGATIQQIVEVTNWQPHTVRGIFAGAFKNKLGLNITSTKEAGCERIYRVDS